MKKTLHCLLPALLIAALALTGCQHVKDFKEDNPVAYEMLADTAKTVLLAQVPRITGDELYQTSLNTVIEAAFQAADAPDAVAAEIESGVAKVFPDDSELQSLVAAEFAEALRDSPDATAPASAPGAREYQLQLADALAPEVSYDYTPDSMPTLSGRDEQIQRLLLVYHAPVSEARQAEVDALYARIDPAPVPGAAAGGHWSDPLWRATEWFSGVDSLDSFKAFHSY